jgi:hypothetical protein
LFFYKQPEQRDKLFSSIRLRLTIISFFFIGGIVGGVFYSSLQLSVLLLAGAALVLGVTFDYLKFGLMMIKRKSAGRKAER